jgi:hypothetical protein
MRCGISRSPWHIGLRVEALGDAVSRRSGQGTYENETDVSRSLDRHCQLRNAEACPRGRWRFVGIANAPGLFGGGYRAGCVHRNVTTRPSEPLRPVGATNNGVSRCPPNISIAKSVAGVFVPVSDGRTPQYRRFISQACWIVEQRRRVRASADFSGMAKTVPAAK